MSILSFAVNDRFVIRVLKHHVNNPDRQWGNTYEALGNDAGSLTDINLLVSTIVLFEKTLHLGDIVFDRATASTWEEDSVPYDPDTFAVYDISGPGTRGGSTPHAALTTALSVVRQPTSGRQGHIFYRGVLSQGDLEAPSGISILTDELAWSEDLDAAVTSSSLDDYMGLSAAGPLVLAMVNKTGTNTRLVMSLAIGGVVELPMDHAWFNRTPPA
jgi:hypothetical protein